MIVKTKYYTKTIHLFDAYLCISKIKFENTQDKELKDLYQLQIDDAERLIAQGEQPIVVIGYIIPEILYQIEGRRSRLKMYDKNGDGVIVQRMSYENYLTEKSNIGLSILKHSIKDHSGFFDHDGKEIVFKTDDNRFVDDDVLDIYALQAFMPYLPDYILYFQSLSPEEKKS